MRKAFIAAVVFGAAFASGHAADAATCTSGANLGQWLSPTFSCTVGDKTFSAFTYTDSASGGVTAVPASEVTVTTVNNGNSGIGFSFNAPWSAGVGQSLDSAIGFTVAVTPPAGGTTITDAALVQAGSSFSGNGIASVAENLGNNVNLLTVDTAGMVRLDDSSTFTGTGSVSVVKDISVRGNEGTASISLVTDTFSQTPGRSVPEPASLALLGVGLLGLGFVAHRRRG